MADKAKLRVADETDKPPVPVNITEALEQDARTVLSAMRLALAKKLDADDVSSNSIASAYKELRELDRQIRNLDAMAEQEAATRVESSRPRRSFKASSL